MATEFLVGDVREVLRTLPDESVHCVVTSPPYWGLRDYGVVDQIGLERTPEEYVVALVDVFREVRRVLRTDGTLWLNIGDSYANPGHYKGNPGDGRASFARREIGWSKAYSKAWPGAKNKDLIGIPWRVALALQSDGWWLRNDIIWSKPRPMPENVKDRLTQAHEHVFLLAKSERYFYDAAAVSEPSYDGKMRNRRDVWAIATEPFPGAHFAVMPTALVEPCILAGCPEGGTVLDPFGGSGTVSVVARRLGRSSVYVDLNPEYAAMARSRLDADTPSLFESAQ